ncbi:MAG: alpha/beta hydrolase, partial [Desulfovibrio sp.]|nr:alpha/beta hydrolase [Desulfovibrio sp.]
MTTPQNIDHQGSRIGVLLIHGLTGTPKEMDSVGRRLNKYGFTVSIPMLPGHCSDRAALLASDAVAWQAAVDCAYEELRRRCDVVFAAGLSAGALMCINLAARSPELRAMALYSITLHWDGWSINRLAFIIPPLLKLPLFARYFRFSESFPYGIKNERLRERIMNKLASGDTSAAGHTDTPGVTLKEMLRIADKAKRAMPRVLTPALIAHAHKDDIAGIGNASYVHKHLGGEREMLVLHDSYHLITVDQERGKVARATA